MGSLLIRALPKAVSVWEIIEVIQAGLGIFAAGRGDGLFISERTSQLFGCFGFWLMNSDLGQATTWDELGELVRPKAPKALPTLISSQQVYMMLPQPLPVFWAEEGLFTSKGGHAATWGPKTYCKDLRCPNGSSTWAALDRLIRWIGPFQDCSGFCTASWSWKNSERRIHARQECWGEGYQKD